ncbi:MAG: hypothetical protein K2H82_10155 [Oscillospiraceae bacterium]|nr:hypothetical protein [Oscillospiraceae bacterium]
MKISRRKLKKALRKLYTEQQPEQMPAFLGQLREQYQKKAEHKQFFARIVKIKKFSVPAMALLILGIMTGYSYLSYRNAYQPYYQTEETEPETIHSTEKIISASEFDTSESKTTGQQKPILHTEMHTQANTTNNIETVLTETQSFSHIVETTITEITDPTELNEKPEFSDTEQIIIPETKPESTIQTETETIPETQKPELTLTREEICSLLEEEPHFSELASEYDIYFDSIGDSIMSNLLSARSRIIPEIVFYFRKPLDQDPALDSVKVPVSMILPEMIDHPVSDLENFLENVFLIKRDSIYWAEDDSMQYTFYTSQQSDLLSGDLKIKLEKAGKNNFSDYDMIYHFASLLQSEYFSLYHPEIENYYFSMNDQDYQKIENLFSTIKRHVPQDHEHYQEWLAAGTYSVKSSHLTQNSYEIAEIYLEYLSYCYLIDTISYELKQHLPEETFSLVQEFNQNWAAQEKYFLEQVIPYEWDESRPEVICFEMESAKCQSLLLLLYLQDIT